jgi:Skp family chaperone for outer membrane proteins
MLRIVVSQIARLLPFLPPESFPGEIFPMTPFLTIARYVAAVLMLLVGSTPLLAQTDAEFPVAVLNLDRIFKTYPPFQAKLAPVKEGVQELEKKAQARQIELETKVAQLRMKQPGSPEFQKLQAEAAKLQAEAQQFVQQERAELQKQEAGIFLELYRQVEGEVQKYAKEHGIKLVIRQQDSSLEEGQPLGEILKSLNRGIIFEEGLDITDEILKALDKPKAEQGTDR